MGKRQETGNTPNKICQCRSFELVFDQLTLNGEELFKELCSKKHGIYQGFAVKHTKKDNSSHVHVGLVLRDKPQDRSFTWKNLKSYFTVKDNIPREHGKLTCPSKDLDKKLQQYFNYCIDEEKHPDETLEIIFLHKWKPKTKQDRMKACDLLTSLIRKGMIPEDLDDLIDNEETSDKVFKEALKNYDIYARMIEKLDEIRTAKKLRESYGEIAEAYRPFQKELVKILDNQSDRNIHGHHDPGETGKNYFIDNESKRKDTLIMQSAETKRIAYAWKPRVHKRIIFDIPKGKMQFINTSVIEKLKNGTLFSTMHHPKMKKSAFKPSILILGNEPIPNNWTEDRLTESTTNKNDFELTMLTGEN